MIFGGGFHEKSDLSEAASSGRNRFALHATSCVSALNRQRWQAPVFCCDIAERGGTSGSVCMTRVSRPSPELHGVGDERVRLKPRNCEHRHSLPDVLDALDESQDRVIDGRVLTSPR